MYPSMTDVVADVVALLRQRPIRQRIRDSRDRVEVGEPAGMRGQPMIRIGEHSDEFVALLL